MTSENYDYEKKIKINETSFYFAFFGFYYFCKQ
jgi:hypothetical protein